MRAQFSRWQPVNNHPVKQTVNTHFQDQFDISGNLTWIQMKAFKKSNDRKTVWVYLMLRNVKVKSWPGSLHITAWNTCLGSRNPQSKMSVFSQLEVTFTLAVNETKQQRVIKAHVFIQGFYRKLISRGMQSCAKLIGGSWHSCREAVVSESYRICIYIHSLLCVSHKTFNSNTLQHVFF